MARLIDKKIQASTLIEVLIAMVIIMIVFAIAMKLFNNVLSSGVSYRKVQVQNQLKVLSEDVKQKGYIADPKLKIDSVTYDFLTDTSAIMGVSKLEIKANQNGRVLGSMKCLFKLQQTDEN